MRPTEASNNNNNNPSLGLKIFKGKEEASKKFVE